MAELTINYDQFASCFDQRYEVCSFSGIGSALANLVSRNAIRRALEVGCGTGHWLRELGLLGVCTTGLDVSCEMLRRARENPGRARLICGSATDLPFAQAEFDLTYCVNAFHHFCQPERFLAEAARVLKPGGHLAIVGLDPHQANTSWYLYDYFEGVGEWDRKRYRPAGQLATSLREANFANVTSAVVESLSHTWQGDEVWHDPFLKKESTSQLMALSQPAYAAGLERIQAAIAGSGAARTPVFRVQLSLVMITGVRS